MCVCLSCTPYWGPGLQLRHGPWLGIELATLWFAGQHSIHWATPASAIHCILSGHVQLTTLCNKKPLSNSRLKIFSYFILEILKFQILYLAIRSILNYFLHVMWNKAWGSLSGVWGHMHVHFVKKNILSPLFSYALVTYPLTISSVPLTFMFVLMPILHCLDYCSCEKDDSSNFSFFLKNALAILGSVFPHINYAISRSVSVWLCQLPANSVQGDV